MIRTVKLINNHQWMMIHPRFHIQHKDSQRICSCTTNLENGTKTSNQVNLIRTINTFMNMVHISFSQHFAKNYITALMCTSVTTPALHNANY